EQFSVSDSTSPTPATQWAYSAVGGATRGMPGVGFSRDWITNPIANASSPAAAIGKIALCNNDRVTGSFRGKGSGACHDRPGVGSIPCRGGGRYRASPVTGTHHQHKQGRGQQHAPPPDRTPGVAQR